MISAKAVPGRRLLSPTDHMLMLIDFQSQMVFATSSIDGITLRNNAALITRAAKVFKVPTLPTTVAAKAFSGPMFDEIKSELSENEVYDRTTMNPWEEAPIVAEINRIGKTRVVMAGLWTSVCIVGPVLTAIDQGFEVYVIADACGDVSREAHDRAMDRMVQAGAQPMTSMQYLLELQRDWGRSETYDATTGIAKALGGSYGLGITYARTMFGEHATEAGG